MDNNRRTYVTEVVQKSSRKCNSGLSLFEKRRGSISTAVAAVVVVVIIVIAGVAAATLLLPGPSTSSTSSAIQSSSPASQTKATSATVSTPAAGQLTPLLFGYGGPPKGSSTAVMLFAGSQLGVWKKYGLNVTVVNVAAGVGQILSALVGGSLQLGDAEPVSLMTALASGSPVKMFGAEMVDADWIIVVSANSTVTSLSQIKGTKFSIAVPAVGGSPWVAALLLTGSAGLKEGTDFTLAPAGSPPATWAVLQQGKVNATATSVPSAIAFSERLHLPYRTISNASELYPKPWVAYGFAATSQFIQQHPDTLKAFLKGYVDAYNYFKNNPDWAISFLMDYYGIDKNQASKLYQLSLHDYIVDTAVNPQALQNVENIARQAGIIKATDRLPPISDWYTNIP